MATVAHAPPAVRSSSLRWSSYAQDALLVVLSAAFAWSHGRAFFAEHQLTSFPFAIEQSILVGLFLFRRRSQYTSSRPGDWAVAAIGTWGTLTLRPIGNAATPLEIAGICIQCLGVSLAAVSFMSLGRSVGVVAANRGLKTGGMYALVRHPIYTAHITTISGFLLANPHPWNLAMAAVVFTGLFLRIEAEERLLVQTDDYASYRQRVPWRLFPKIY